MTEHGALDFSHTEPSAAAQRRRARHAALARLAPSMPRGRRRPEFGLRLTLAPPFPHTQPHTHHTHTHTAASLSFFGSKVGPRNSLILSPLSSSALFLGPGIIIIIIIIIVSLSFYRPSLASSASSEPSRRSVVRPCLDLDLAFGERFADSAALKRPTTV